MNEANDDFETRVEIRKSNYRIKMSVKNTSMFTILLIDEDIPDRWSADFSSSYIYDLTHKVGHIKKPGVFWNMLKSAIEKTSKEVSLDILTPNDIGVLKNESINHAIIPSSDEKRYIVVTQETQFDKVHFPLLLNKTPFSIDELRFMIRRIKIENKKLENSDAPAIQNQSIRDLEKELYQLNQVYHEISHQKEDEISILRKQVQDLERYNKPPYQNTGNSRIRPPPLNLNQKK